jgi:hypothetical protein
MSSESVMGAIERATDGSVAGPAPFLYTPSRSKGGPGQKIGVARPKLLGLAQGVSSVSTWGCGRPHWS